MQAISLPGAYRYQSSLCHRHEYSRFIKKIGQMTQCLPSACNGRHFACRRTSTAMHSQRRGYRIRVSIAVTHEYRESAPEQDMNIVHYGLDADAESRISRVEVLDGQ
jgi:hypothetical protein